MLISVRNDRLAKTESSHLQLFQLGWRQLRIAFCQETNGVVHPFGLIVFGGVNYTTLPDGTEKLVARAVKRGFLALAR